MYTTIELLLTQYLKEIICNLNNEQLEDCVFLKKIWMLFKVKVENGERRGREREMRLWEREREG